MFWLISSPFSNLPGILLAREQAFERTHPCGSGRCLGQGFTLIADQGVAPSLCRHWVVMSGSGGGWDVGRHYLFSFEKWSCSVSMGRSVPTLQSDSLSLGGVASFMRKIPENECLFFLQVDGVSGGSHQRLWLTCLPLGVSSWLPNLPPGCSCCL